MKQAIVAIEDRRFWEHSGVDLRGVLRALVRPTCASRASSQGGSTITQQFVKNQYVRNTRTIGRKVREAALAWQLEQRWSKERILTAYLNTIYFGNGAYGIAAGGPGLLPQRRARADAAARRRCSPGCRRTRRLRPGGEPARGARAARAGAPGDARRRARSRRPSSPPRGAAPLPTIRVRSPAREGPAPYFVNYVKQQLVDAFGAAAASSAAACA